MADAVPKYDVAAQGALPELKFAEGVTLAERAYETIRRDILWGVLEPGAHLTGETLKARYNIGPTPIREALFRLTECGLLQTEERRGFRVPPLSYEDIHDIIHMRQVLESEAIRRAVLNASDEWESRVLAAYHRMFRVEEAADRTGVLEWELWEERHTEFHAILIEGAGSPRMSRFHRLLYDQGNRYRRVIQPLVTQIDEAKNDHKRILDFVLGRQADEAAAAAAEHIGRLSTFVKNRLYPKENSGSR